MSNFQHSHPPNTATTACPTCLKEGSKYTERAQRGFSEEDTFSFNHYLAGVIAGGLDLLAERGIGAPAAFYEDRENFSDDTAALEKWRAVLGEMALGFRLYHDRDMPDDLPPELDRSFELLREWWGHLWD